MQLTDAVRKPLSLVPFSPFLSHRIGTAFAAGNPESGGVGAIPTSIVPGGDASIAAL
jgi:hypothetical protein